MNKLVVRESNSDSSSGGGLFFFVVFIIAMLVLGKLWDQYPQYTSTFLFLPFLTLTFLDYF